MVKKTNKDTRRTFHLEPKDHERLGKLGTVDDTYPSVIRKLMDFYETYKDVEDILCKKCKPKFSLLAEHVTN
jgi:hypothetical protein